MWKPFDVVLIVIAAASGFVGLLWLAVVITAEVADDATDGSDFATTGLGSFILLLVAAVALRVLWGRERK